MLRTNDHALLAVRSHISLSISVALAVVVSGPMCDVPLSQECLLQDNDPRRFLQTVAYGDYYHWVSSLSNFCHYHIGTTYMHVNVSQFNRFEVLSAVPRERARGYGRYAWQVRRCCFQTEQDYERSLNPVATQKCVVDSTKYFICIELILYRILSSDYNYLASLQSRPKYLLTHHTIPYLI